MSDKYCDNNVDFPGQLFTCFPSSLHGLMTSKIIDTLFVQVEKLTKLKTNEVVETSFTHFADTNICKVLWSLNHKVWSALHR